MNKWTDGEELARFSKSSCEDVRLTLHKWTIGQYLEIRAWSKVRPSAPSKTGPRRSLAAPTEHGLVLDVELLPDLRQAIDKAIVALGGEASDREFIIKVIHAGGDKA